MGVVYGCQEAYLWHRSKHAKYCLGLGVSQCHPVYVVQNYVQVVWYAHMICFILPA